MKAPPQDLSSTLGPTFLIPSLWELGSHMLEWGVGQGLGNATHIQTIALSFPHASALAGILF